MNVMPMPTHTLCLSCTFRQSDVGVQKTLGSPRSKREQMHTQNRHRSSNVCMLSIRAMIRLGTKNNFILAGSLKVNGLSAMKSRFGTFGYLWLLFLKWAPGCQRGDNVETWFPYRRSKRSFGCFLRFSSFLSLYLVPFGPCFLSAPDGSD